ncbi:rRNA maturation RNase YbeY [Aurantivibrio infirmus]
MNIVVDTQIASEDDDAPDPATVTHWVSQVIQHLAISGDIEVSVRIVDQEEGQRLNSQYRQKDYATNVLSFPIEKNDDIPFRHLGDIVACHPVIKRESAEQNKTLGQHWAHMIIHGSLHLLGYDHINDDEAEIMEAIEIKILSELGYGNPYTSQEQLASNLPY